MKLTVLSLNVWHGGRLFEPIVAFLREVDADIVLLQEVYHASDPGLPSRFRTLEVLGEKLRYAHKAYAPAMIQYMPEGQIPAGSGILSRFPIADNEVVFFNEPFNDHYISAPENYPLAPRPLQSAFVQTPAGGLTVLNMHGVWDLDGDNYSVKRQRMSERLVAAVKGKSRLVLAGDSNAKPTNQALRNLEPYLTKVFLDDRQTSFNMRRKDNPGYATAAVDHMYVSPDIRVLESHCPDVDVSDHLPIWAVLEAD